MAENDDSGAIYPSLRGKRVLITGGGSGIGAGLVEGFIRQGSSVTFLDILNGESDALAERTGAHFERVDLTDTPATTGIIRKLVDANGPFNVLVNNAASDDRHGIDDDSHRLSGGRREVRRDRRLQRAEAAGP